MLSRCCASWNVVRKRKKEKFANKRRIRLRPWPFSILRWGLAPRNLSESRLYDRFHSVHGLVHALSRYRWDKRRGGMQPQKDIIDVWRRVICIIIVLKFIRGRKFRDMIVLYDYFKQNCRHLSVIYGNSYLPFARKIELWPSIRCPWLYVSLST